MYITLSPYLGFTFVYYLGSKVTASYVTMHSPPLLLVININQISCPLPIAKVHLIDPSGLLVTFQLPSSNPDFISLLHFFKASSPPAILFSHLSYSHQSSCRINAAVWAILCSLLPWLIVDPTSSLLPPSYASHHINAGFACTCCDVHPLIIQQLLPFPLITLVLVCYIVYCHCSIKG